MKVVKFKDCGIEGCSDPMFSRTWCQFHYTTWRNHGDPLHPVKRRQRQGAECSYEGCDDKPQRRGLCNKHAKREEKYDDLREPHERRFWAKVDQSGGSDACWPWTGQIAKNGYGQYGMTGTRLTHRIAYQYSVGPIPQGLVLDHLCHTRDPQCDDGDACEHRRCCNPGHLEPISRRENVKRGRSGDSWGYVSDPLPSKPTERPKPATCTECKGERGKPLYKRTLCRPCYKKWLRDPTVERPSQRTPEQRFWMKVDKNGPLPPTKPELGPCWVWTAHINKGTGYGQFAPKHGVQVGSHRYSYELANGPIPEGYDVHHRCDVRSCCRPDHLQALTRSQNLAERPNRRNV